MSKITTSPVNNSKQQMIKSSAVVGGASVITIIIGLIKVKALAVLLGPAGIGLMGLLLAFMTIGATLFSLGIGTSGVRQIAFNDNDINKVSLIKTALLFISIIMGLTSVILIYTFKELISLTLFNSVEYSFSVFIIAIGVFFSLLSSSQLAVLQGLRKITVLAKVKIIAAIFASIIGLLLVYQFGEKSIAIFVIAVPILSFVVALFFTTKLAVPFCFNIKAINMQIKSLIMLGMAFMLTGVMSTSSQFLVRYILNDQLNIESVGYFQAAWSISMTYIGFVLGAMAADYYPRLTSQINCKISSNQLVNEQTEMALIIAAPVLIAMLTFSNFIIWLLYSSEFSAAENILRWQVMGDILKIASWPLGFILLAQGKGKLFFIAEFTWNIFYLSSVFFLIKYLGVGVTGYAFFASYLVYLVLVYGLAKKVNSFNWNKSNVFFITKLLLASTLITITSYFSLLVSYIIGGFAVCYYAYKAFNYLESIGFNLFKFIRKI